MVDLILIAPLKRNRHRRKVVLWLTLLLLATSRNGIIVDAQQDECPYYAPPAVIKGNKIFVSTTGQYLPIRGIDYYPRPNAGDLVLGNSQDFFSESFRSSWERDIGQFQALHLNAIRLYAVNPGVNHDGFMCALKKAGMYVLIGLAADCKNCAIQYQDPPDCYPQEYKQRGQFIINQFAKYENVLGFSAGNEVALSAVSNIGNLPCQKKFLRDMREYVQNCVETQQMRHIPIGVIMADNQRMLKAQYYNCRTDPNDEFENAEWIGINAYLQCDGTATSIDQLIGLRTLLAGFQQVGLTMPALLTEFGCLSNTFPTINGYEAQRNFLQVDALFSSDYRSVFNGGFVFEYNVEKVYSQQNSPFPFTGFGAGNYGVGYFTPEDCDEIDIPCKYVPKPEFQNLASRYADAANVSQEEPNMANFNPPDNATLPSCPDFFPPLSTHEWPTDVSGVAPLSCPARLPVYCTGIPNVCITVPPPSAPSPTPPSAVTASTPKASASPTSTMGTTVPVETYSPTKAEEGHALQPTQSPLASENPDSVQQNGNSTSIPPSSLPTVEQFSMASSSSPTTGEKGPALQPSQFPRASENPNSAQQNSNSTSIPTSSLPAVEQSTMASSSSPTTGASPSYAPTPLPSLKPSEVPSAAPSDTSAEPSDFPSTEPSMSPLSLSSFPSTLPSQAQTDQPSGRPSSVLDGMTAALNDDNSIADQIVTSSAPALALTSARRWSSYTLVLSAIIYSVL